jgi:hypothetical protein
MMPQSNFAIVAPIIPDRIDALRSLLETMTLCPGTANPSNPVIPFASFKGLHYARLVILDDRTLSDLTYFDVPVPEYPITLAVLGDCDGPADDCLAALTKGAGDGLRRIFSHCTGFDPAADLFAWMKQHSLRSAASYVNWIGRTVCQVREEAALRDALLAYLRANPSASDDLQGIRQSCMEFVAAERHAGRLSLTAPEPTPAAWWWSNLVHCASVPAALVLVAITIIVVPVLLIPLVLLVFAFLWLLRRFEKSEPEIVVRPESSHDMMLAKHEDHDVTNQFTVLGSVKPGLFRRFTLTTVLWLIDYGARHIYNRGHLGRIRTIHFARWVFLDRMRRVLFASNYDGSLESYMDDFINKVGWGLNLVFSNGVGYPRANWLVRDGSKEEQKFKYTLRRHQVPTQVWYKAYPGLTAFDLARNARVRQGLERHTMTDDEIRTWLRDL